MSSHERGGSGPKIIPPCLLIIWPCQACKIFMANQFKPFRRDFLLDLLLNARVHRPCHASVILQRVTTKSVSYQLPSYWLRDIIFTQNERIEQIFMVLRRNKLEKADFCRNHFNLLKIGYVTVELKRLNKPSSFVSNWVSSVPKAIIHTTCRKILI